MTNPTPTALSPLIERLIEIEQRHRAAQGWAKSAGHVGFGERTGATDYPERWKLDTAIDAHKDRAFLLSTLKSSAAREAAMVEALRDSTVANDRLILMLEDSLAGQTNDHGVKWERAITDVEIARDGSYRLSDARKAVHNARNALSSPSEAAAALLSRLAALEAKTKSEAELGDVTAKENHTLRIRAEQAEAKLEAAQKNARTPGTVEVCPICQSTAPPFVGPWCSKRCPIKHPEAHEVVDIRTASSPQAVGES